MREDLPGLDAIQAMSNAQRLRLLENLDALADAVSACRGAVRVLLHVPPPPPPLLDAKETARRLAMSEDWVRDHGDELGIEVRLGTTRRYDPEAVEALQRRRNGAGVR